MDIDNEWNNIRFPVSNDKNFQLFCSLNEHFVAIDYIISYYPHPFPIQRYAGSNYNWDIILVTKTFYMVYFFEMSSSIVDTRNSKNRLLNKHAISSKTLNDIVIKM